jgi:phage baseplate assembly protein gpV
MNPFWLGVLLASGLLTSVRLTVTFCIGKVGELKGAWVRIDQRKRMKC